MKQFWNQIQCDAQMEMWMATSNQNEYRVWGDDIYLIVLLKVIISMVYQVFLRMDCKFTGHSIVDDSYGGPESGCIDLSCEHCGENWFTRLY